MHVLMQEGEGKGKVCYQPSPLVPNLISSLLPPAVTVWHENLVRIKFGEMAVF